MELEITLGNEQAFWFLDGGKCHVSSDNPGPITVDFSKLTKDEQKQIIIAGRSKTILLSLHDTVLVEEFNGQSIVPKAPIAQPNDTNKRLEAILEKSTADIKREIASINSYRELRILRDIEAKNKNRGKLIKLMDEKLLRIGQDVSDEILSNEENIELKSEDPVADSMEVTESDIEIREVPINGDN